MRCWAVSLYQEGDNAFKGAQIYVFLYYFIFFFCICFSRRNQECGNIFNFLPKIISTKICFCQLDRVFSWQSPQPSRGEFNAHLIFYTLRSWKVIFRTTIFCSLTLGGSSCWKCWTIFKEHLWAAADRERKRSSKWKARGQEHREKDGRWA